MLTIDINPYSTPSKTTVLGEEVQTSRIKLAVEISGKGEIKLLGTGIETSGKGAIELKFKRVDLSK